MERSAHRTCDRACAARRRRAVRGTTDYNSENKSRSACAPNRRPAAAAAAPTPPPAATRGRRSEEHTCELQSLMRISYAVFCLKKKKNTTLQRIKLTRHKH